jgi:hypothetical protein
MSNSTIKRYTFGPDDMYFYEFMVHSSVVPGGGKTIVTIMMSSTNVRNVSPSTIDQYIPGLIQFLANLCIEYNASYDAYHNYLVPYSHQDSSNIADNVNARIQNIKSQSTLYNLI